MADWNGVPFLLVLFSADRFKDRAIFFGSFDLNTPDSRSSASLVSITRCDHFFFGRVFLAVFPGALLLRAVEVFFPAVVVFLFLVVAIGIFLQPMQA
jgi:hypothetical protein